MANPWPGINTLSTATTSSGIGLDPTARTTMVLIDLSGLAGSTAGGTADVTIQATLDVFTSTYTGTSSANVVWNNLSTTHYSSASYPGAGLITIASPVAGLRLSSTAWTSGPVSVTLKAMQEIIG